MTVIPEQKIRAGQYWTDSLTLVSGCSAVSEGCANCWSAGMASRFEWGKDFARNGKWTGLVEPNYKALEKLEKRAASERKLNPRVWQIWNDFFYWPIHWPTYSEQFKLMGDAWQCMRRRPDDIFLLLTKRPENVGLFSKYSSMFTIPANIYIGVSVESQKHIGRIDQLIQNWPGKKFVSIEPCLGAVDLNPYLPKRSMEGELLFSYREGIQQYLDQVIIGCESGANRRQPPPTRDLLTMTSQCEDAGVPAFIKQWEFNGRLVKMPVIGGCRWDQLAWNEKGETE